MSKKKKTSIGSDFMKNAKGSFVENKKKIMSYSLVLFVAAFASALLLAGVNELIHADDRNKTNSDTIDVMSRIFPAEEYKIKENGFEKREEIRAVYEAYDGGEIKGHCVEVKVKDHTDTLSLVVAIDGEMKVHAVEVTEMSENAGTGIKVKSSAFLANFKGKSNIITAIKGEPKEKNQISVISGATVSSKAVTEGVNMAIAAVSQIEADNVKIREEAGANGTETDAPGVMPAEADEPHVNAEAEEETEE